MMGVLEAVADFFYDPYAYWGLPLLLAVLREVISRPRAPGIGPGAGPEPPSGHQD
ncbi:MAG: hypothetical protein IIC64_15165 [SAR324 cluster bacterium]|nr:hypothetical protein [SAR324 cluster bacterium]